MTQKADDKPLADRRFTRREIDAKRTPKGGFTKKQLAEWGVGWPASKGWIDRLVDGSHKPEPIACSEQCPAHRITDAAKRAIMKAAGVQADKAMELLAAEYEL